MMKECSRILKTGGSYVAITYAKKNEREMHFKRDFLGFDVKSFTIRNFGKNSKEMLEENSMFVCTKTSAAKENFEKHYHREVLDENSSLKTLDEAVAKVKENKSSE